MQVCDPPEHILLPSPASIAAAHETLRNRPIVARHH
jgi:hypothetical protein